MIEQTPVEVEHFRRLPNGNWEIAAFRTPDDVIHLETLGCDLPVAEIYRGVEKLG